MTFNRDNAAAALLEALYTTDEQAARKYGVSLRTLRRWRARLATDSDLAAFVHTKKKLCDEAWAVEAIPVALTKGLQFIGEAAQRATADDSSYQNPELIRAVSGAFKACAEVYFTSRVIDARLESR